MLILAIESSCDETSIAIAKADYKNVSDLDIHPITILSNIVSSQVKIHAKWGGVVPNLAAREHLKNIIPVLNQALLEANVKIEDIDLIATTQGPGLIPALLIGTNVAKTLSYFYQKLLLGIHHVEGHIYANLSSQDNVITFPALCLTVSGGHSQLILMKDHLQYELIGQTIDDAAGEAFDKVAKILELGYPGGPIVSQRAKNARESKKNISVQSLEKALLSITFPRPLLKNDNLDFSFSGLKTAVLYFYKKLLETKPELKENEELHNLWKDYICLAFEDAIVDVLVKKTLRAIKKYQPKTIMMAGGVAANGYLRESLEKSVKEFDPTINFIKPKLELCGDNAAMMTIAASYRYLDLKNKNQLSTLTDNWKTLEANANLKLI